MEATRVEFHVLPSKNMRRDKRLSHIVGSGNRLYVGREESRSDGEVVLKAVYIFEPDWTRMSEMYENLIAGIDANYRVNSRRFPQRVLPRVKLYLHGNREQFEEALSAEF